MQRDSVAGQTFAYSRLNQFLVGFDREMSRSFSISVASSFRTFFDHMTCHSLIRRISFKRPPVNHISCTASPASRHNALRSARLEGANGGLSKICTSVAYSQGSTVDVQIPEFCYLQSRTQPSREIQLFPLSCAGSEERTD